MAEPITPSYLRLFPLQSVVLLPGMELPLSVFERRYLQLVKECTEANEPFGIQLIRSGSEVGDENVTTYQMGTTAQIVNVERMGGGQLRVDVVGKQRFRIISYLRDKPFISAMVEILPDEVGVLDGEVERRVRRYAQQYMRAVIASQGGYISDVPLPGHPNDLSWTVAELFQGNPMTLQRLLEAPTTGVRLQQEVGILEAALENIQRDRRNDRRLNGPSGRFSKN
jgi:ATP-dependent Lon protease